MCFPENHVDRETDYTFEGTVAHTLADRALTYEKPASFWIGETIQYVEHGRVGTITAEMADYVQVYLDYVANLSVGGVAMAEQRVNLSEVLGIPDQGGTADFVVIKGSHIDVVDLKYGKGERVYAEKNTQLGLYALGAISKYQLLGPFKSCTLHIVQPRLDVIDTFPCTDEWLAKLAADSKAAVERASEAMYKSGPNGEGIDEYLQDSPKACRWCEVKTKCPKLTKSLQDQTAAEFADMARPGFPVPLFEGETDELLVKKYQALNWITKWAKAVQAEIYRRATGNEKPLIGPDGQPMKLVEGGGGKRAWSDKNAAAAAMLQHFAPDQVYKPAEPITAPEAEKLLVKKLGGKKKAEPLWKDAFAPLCPKTKGKPTVAWGSDERPAITTTATADEFETGDSDDE
jgi:hypothetical protein